MSTSIHALLADELGISEARAEKLLRAMMREVKNRAKRGNGVRIPDLGTFSEENGTLQFTPSDSLARAVNQEFEGLDAEDLSTAAPPVEEKEEDGPTTLAPGFSSPLGGSSSSGADTDEFQAAGGSEPDTAEFQAPDEGGADTAEFQAPDDGADTADFEAPADPSTEGASGDDSGSRSSAGTSTGELYPMVDDVPEASDPDAGAPDAGTPDDGASDDGASDDGPVEVGSESSSPEAEPASSEENSGRTLWGGDRPADSSSKPSSKPQADAEEEPEEEEENIWASDNPWDLSTASYDEDDEEEAPSGATGSEAGEPAPQQEETAADRAPTPGMAGPPQGVPGDGEASSGGSSAARVLVGALVLLLLGAAGWFVLGRQGVVPAPQMVLAELTQPRPAAMEPPSQADSPSPSAPETSETPSRSTTPSGGDSDSPSASPSATPSDRSAGSEDGSADGSPQATPDADSPAASPAASPSRTFDRSRGGFTIAVASRTQQSEAQRLVDMYRDRFGGTDYPVDVLSATTNGTTRYRVGVGQFASRDAARDAMQRHSGDLPDDAWPVEIQ